MKSLETKRKMANNSSNLEGHSTHVIQHHMSQPGTEAQVSVHQVPNSSGGKRHQIIIDIKQDIDMDEMSTRSLAESVMETLGARSATVYIDDCQVSGQNPDLESLTTVNVIVANDMNQVSPKVEEDTQSETRESAGSPVILPGNRIAVDRIVEMTSTSSETTTTATLTTVSITAASTASGEFYLAAIFVF